MGKLLVCMTVVCCLALPSRAADWRLNASQLPENCFGDRDVACALQLTASTAQAIRVQWQVTFERRVWRNGSIRANTAANESTNIAFEFRAPPVNAGVIAGGKLRVRVLDEQDNELLQQDFPIWVFHDNPFATEFDWLRMIPIELIDPDQQLAGRLSEIDFPGKLDGQQSKRARVLIVAQHANLDAATTMKIEQALLHGQRVLCLASQKAQLRLARPTWMSDRNELPEVHAGNFDFMQQLERRLSSAPLSVVGRFRLDMQPDDRVSMVIRPDQPGWTFFEYGFETRPNARAIEPSAWSIARADRRPQFIYCGLDLMSRWRESPTPRYVLAHLLARICVEPELNSPSKDLP